MIATISTAITILKFLKKNWHWIVMGIMVIGFGIAITILSIKLRNRDKEIIKLETKVEELHATNTLLLKDRVVDNKQTATITNFVTSEIAVSNIVDYYLSNDVISSVNQIINNYDYDFKNNTLGGNK